MAVLVFDFTSWGESGGEPRSACDHTRLQRAREKCQKLIDTFVEQSRSNVELIDVLPASQKTRKRYICRFKSEVEP